MYEFNKWLQISGGAPHVSFLNHTGRLLSGNIYFHLQWMKKKKKKIKAEVSHLLLLPVCRLMFEFHH